MVWLRGNVRQSQENGLCLPFAVALSPRTSRTIRQNLWASLGVVAVLIPATIAGLNIGAAVVFHEGSTLLAIVNALRLLAFVDEDTAFAPRGVRQNHGAMSGDKLG